MTKEITDIVITYTVSNCWSNKGVITSFDTLKDALIHAQGIGMDTEVWVKTKTSYDDGSEQWATAYIVHVMWNDTPMEVIDSMI